MTRKRLILRRKLTPNPTPVEAFCKAVDAVAEAPAPSPPRSGQTFVGSGSLYANGGFIGNVSDLQITPHQLHPTDLLYGRAESGDRYIRSAQFRRLEIGMVFRTVDTDSPLWGKHSVDLARLQGSVGVTRAMREDELVLVTQGCYDIIEQNEDPTLVVHASRASRDGYVYVTRYIRVPFSSLAIDAEFSFTTSGMSYRKTGAHNYVNGLRSRSLVMADIHAEVYRLRSTRETQT